MKQEKSFTLIELLVVIAIIGLLASIVLVSTSGIQSKAKITKTLEFSQSLQRALGAYAVGIWSFDDQTNPTKDGSGYGNNGTISGATYTTDTPHAAIGRGTGKYALSFDGQNDYVSVADSTSLDITGTAVTIEAWFKKQGTQVWPTDWTIASKAYDCKGYGLTIMNDFKVWFLLGNGGPGCWEKAISTTIPNYDVWYHVVGTFDGSNMRIYINGVLENTAAFSGSILSTISSLLIGKNPGVAWYFNGLIDEVRVYGIALTLGEVQRHYAEGLERHQNLAINQK